MKTIFIAFTAISRALGLPHAQRILDNSLTRSMKVWSKMVRLYFVLVVILIFPLVLEGKTLTCDVKEKRTAAPVFDSGENLSYKDCGVNEQGSKLKPPWRVWIRSKQRACRGILISKTAVITHACVKAITEFEQIRANFYAYLGDCFESNNEKICLSNDKGLRLMVKNVTRLKVNPRSEIFVWRIEKSTNFKTQHISPICLFNRKGGNVLDKYDSPIVHSDALTYYTDKVEPANISNCVSKRFYKDADCVHLNMLICVNINLSTGKILKKTNEYLLDHHKGRFFLRGISQRNFERVGHSAFIDLLPIMHEVVSAASGIWIMAKIPTAPKATNFTNGGAENLSFPGCGKRRIFKRESLTLEPATIVKGFDASSDPAGHPWHAEIRYADNSSKHGFCGGSLISKRAVLTAAHCFVIYNVTANDVVVTLGLSDVRKRNKGYVQSQTPSRLVIHPGFNLESNSNDIALVLFPRDFKITKKVIPICLWNEDYSLNRILDLTGVVFGWGYLANHKQPNVLQAANMQIRSYKDCYLQRRQFFGPYMKPGLNFCAGHSNGTTTCEGDSGAGLAIMKNDTWFIRGVESLGRGEFVTLSDGSKKNVCKTGFYTLYTDLGNYIKWIMENVQDMN
ncbi:Hypothetical predicted protein [Cloeon dipterum]|uniref:Peptidase S1 domain-containing protein n=1 Tax=Cloeon dipterum TaxID=197152 RepID=A0A8S1DRI6_9INSE|nr:Hypothetical predicted protein [Cloeon dipterum]